MKTFNELSGPESTRKEQATVEEVKEIESKGKKLLFVCQKTEKDKNIRKDTKPLFTRWFSFMTSKNFERCCLSFLNLKN